jgi:flagellar protein FliS
MSKKSNINQYSSIDLENEVANADPHRLVQLLFEGALVRLSRAKIFIDQNDYESKNSSLGRVAEIIGTLQESLDLEKGGNIAGNLYQLYDYMLRRLLIANKNNDKAIVDEVIKLLAEVKSGWDSIREDYVKANAQARPPSPSASLSESLKA